jgi:hypothetical protein
MEIQEIPLSYLKEIAKQLIFISAFLGGFSAAILGTLIVSTKSSKTLKYLILGTSLSALSFIVSVFAMTKIVMIALPDSPFNGNYEATIVPRTIGSIAFFLGIIALIFTISISGWTHSKKLGIATTTLGIIGLVLVFMAM